MAETDAVASTAEWIPVGQVPNSPGDQVPYRLVLPDVFAYWYWKSVSADANPSQYVVPESIVMLEPSVYL